jgi:hypothetical protein
MAAPFLTIGIAGFIALRFLNFRLERDTDLFIQLHGPTLLNWGISFLFLQILCPEIILIAAALLLIRVNGGVHDPALIWSLGVLAVVQGLAVMDVRDGAMKSAVAAAIAGLCLYGQWRSPDFLYHFWDRERWTISQLHQQTLDMLGKVPPSATVAASDALTVPLADHPYLVTLVVARGQSFPPDYVATGGEPTVYDRDNRYILLEANAQTGARLLKRTR